MTYYLPLIVLVAVVAFVSTLLDRRWQARKTASESTEATETQPGATSRITSRFQGVRERISRVRERISSKKQAELAKQFQAWAAVHLTGEEGLTDWIANLSEDGAQALTEQLATFCSDLNFELSWLIKGDLDADPDLKLVGENMVAAYSSACLKAALAQDDLTAFKTFQTFEKAPTNTKHREFAQELYAKLVEKELVSPPSTSEIFLASEKQRLQQAAEAIRQAAEKDREAFNHVLKVVVAEMNAPDRETSDEAQQHEPAPEAGEQDKPASATA